jgi:hypothetical protein
MAEQPSAPQLPPPLPPLPLPQPPPHLPYPPLPPFAASFYQPSERGFSTALRFLLTRRLGEALTARNVFETRDAIDKALSTLSLVANCKPEVRAAVQLEASGALGDLSDSQRPNLSAASFGSYASSRAPPASDVEQPFTANDAVVDNVVVAAA